MVYSVANFVGIPLVAVVTAVMLWRRLYREFPFFVAYLFVVMAAEVIRYVLLTPNSLRYFYTYWITEAISVFFAFLVLYEVFLIRLFPGFNIASIYRYLFPVGGLIVIILTALMFSSAPSRSPGILAVIVGEFALALSFLQVAVLVFFSCLLLLMSREWTHYDFGIAFGFGVHAAFKLITTLIRAQNGYHATKFDQLPVVSYTIAVLIWLFYLSHDTQSEREALLTGNMEGKRNNSGGFGIKDFSAVRRANLALSAWSWPRRPL